MGIRSGKEQDWRVMCESTPFTWDGVTYSSPSRCEERVSQVSAHSPAPKANSYHRASVQKLQCGMSPLKVVGIE